MKRNAVLTSTLVACALITPGFVVHRQRYAPEAKPVTVPSELTPTFFEDWKSHLGIGVRIGPSNAPVQLVEFGDFECRSCVTLHARLKALRSRYPDDVALSYVYFPLRAHRLSERAARAAECAHEQGRFAKMHDLLFEQQGNLGLKSWSAFAAEAGVLDVDYFSDCMEKRGPTQSIVRGRALGERLGIRRTPSFVINGWRLARPPTAEELDYMVQAILGGQPPVAEGR
jgi:protein-disulfide isomerase